MNDDQLVSICIPTYNRANSIGDTIKSALSQTYENIEVIVVDNASTDKTEEVVNSFDDPRLSYVRNRRNLGLFGNFNRCIELYSGEFLHILHSDDTIPPNFTATCMEFIAAHPEVSLTCTPPLTLSRDGNEIISRRFDEPAIFMPPEGMSVILSGRNFIVCPSVMVRRGVFEQYNGFSMEYSYSSDYYQYLRVARDYVIAYIPDTYLSYSTGEHTESYRLLFRSPTGYLDTLRIYIQLIQDLNDEYPAYKEEINKSLFTFAGDCVFAGFTRGEEMKPFIPRMFNELAADALILISPISAGEVFKKMGWRIFVTLSGFSMRFGFFRKRIGNRLLRRSGDHLY